MKARSPGAVSALKVMVQLSSGVTNQRLKVLGERAVWGD